MAVTFKFESQWKMRHISVVVFLKTYPFAQIFSYFVSSVYNYYRINNIKNEDSKTVVHCIIRGWKQSTIVYKEILSVVCCKKLIQWLFATPSSLLTTPDTFKDVNISYSTFLTKELRVHRALSLKIPSTIRVSNTFSLSSQNLSWMLIGLSDRSYIYFDLESKINRTSKKFIRAILLWLWLQFIVHTLKAHTQHAFQRSRPRKAPHYVNKQELVVHARMNMITTHAWINTLQNSWH